MAHRKAPAPVSAQTLNEGRNTSFGKTSVPASKSTSHVEQAPWRDTLPIHPAAELFPRMSPNELKALGADIEKNGQRQPIAIIKKARRRPDGTFHVRDLPLQIVLDGISRLDAMESAGIQIIGKDGQLADHVERIVVDTDEVDPVAYVISANIHRRHLTAEQKRDVIGNLLKATPEKSNRQIAETVKADHKTVASVRAEKEATGEIPQLPKTVGKDRKARPSKRKRPPTEEMAARKAAVPIPLPTETVVREAVAPDEELALLREFARFVINRARVSTDPKDHIEWKMLLDRVEQVGSLKKEKDHD